MKKVISNQSFALNILRMLALIGAMAFPLIGSSAESPEQKSLVLQNISCDRTNSNIFVDIELNQKPIWETVDVEEHGGFFQLSLPQTTIANPGKFYDCVQGAISKISGFQVSQDDGAVRIFLDPQKNPPLKKATAQTLDNHIMVAFDEVIAASAPANAPEKLDSKVIPAPKMPAGTEVGPEKSVLTKFGSNDFFTRYQRSLNKLLIASIVLIFAFVISLLMRPYIRRREKRMQKEGRDTEMAVLKTMSLNTKQKLCLIQVGAEQLLLSVANDGVRLIKVLDSAPKQRALTHFNYKESMPRTSSSFELNASDEDSTLTLKNSPFAQTKPQLSSESKSTNLRRIDAEKTLPKERLVRNDASVAQRINLAIDDDGIHQNASKYSNESEKKIKSIDDVTMLIREKLKDLR